MGAKEDRVPHALGQGRKEKLSTSGQNEERVFWWRFNGLDTDTTCPLDVSALPWACGKTAGLLLLRPPASLHICTLGRLTTFTLFAHRRTSNPLNHLPKAQLFQDAESFGRMHRPISSSRPERRRFFPVTGVGTRGTWQCRFRFESLSMIRFIPRITSNRVLGRALDSESSLAPSLSNVLTWGWRRLQLRLFLLPFSGLRATVW